MTTDEPLDPTIAPGFLTVVSLTLAGWFAFFDPHYMMFATSMLAAVASAVATGALRVRATKTYGELQR